MQYSLFNNPPQATWPTGSFLVMDAAGVRLAKPQEILAKAADLAAMPEQQRLMLSSPKAAGDIFAARLNATLEHEVFAMMLLDTQHQLIQYDEPFRGTLAQAAVYPREIVKDALRANAAAVIIAHNHPSGSLEPSQADIEITKQLSKALGLVDIRLLDHILVAGGKTRSFAELGLML